MIYPADVVLAEIYDVNTVRDVWDKIGWIVQLVGALGALVAIGFAVVAQRDATASRRDAVKERRRLFELEVLRELVREVDESPWFVSGGISWNAESLRRYQQRLVLIAGEDLPYWRRLTESDWVDERAAAKGHDVTSRRLAEAWADLDLHNRKRIFNGGALAKEWGEREQELKGNLHVLSREVHAYVLGRLVTELHDAILNRVEAGTVVPIRRSWRRPSTWRGQRIVGQ